MSKGRDRAFSELMILRHLRGDRQAMGRLIGRWEDRLFYYIMRLVGQEEDAWDALQDVWVALAGNVGRLRDTESIPAWLYSTARNKAIDRLRARYRNQTVPFECEETLEIEQPQESFSFEDAEAVHGAMEKLSACHREALTLFFLDDLSIEETSFVLQVPEGTVKSRLHHAKRALKKILEEEELAR